MRCSYAPPLVSGDNNIVTLVSGACCSQGPGCDQTGQCQPVSAQPLPSYVYTRISNVQCSMCLSTTILLIWNTVSGLWEAGNQVSWNQVTGRFSILVLALLRYAPMPGCFIVELGSNIHLMNI